MDNRALNYINEQIAAQGYVITSSKWAAICSPANYGNGQSALSLEGSPTLTATMKQLGTKPYRVNFKDGSMATCWLKSRTTNGHITRVSKLSVIYYQISQ